MMRLLGPRVLVALPPKQDEYTSPSGLVLARDPDATFTETRGIVMQLGDKRGTVDLDDVRSEVHSYFLAPANFVSADNIDRVLMKMQPAPFEVQAGDMVIFPPTAGQNITVDGLDYVILHEADILGIVEPINNEAA